MASIAGQGVAQDMATRAVVRDVGFPGRTVTGLCMIIAPLLAIIGSLAAVGIYHAKGADFAAGMVGHHFQGEIAFNFAVAGSILLIFAITGVAQAIARVRPRLGQAAGVLVIIGLCGPLFFNGVYFGGFQLMQFSQPSASIAGKMMDQAQIIPSNIINISGPALVIGFILLGIGAAKAGVLPRWRAWALGITCITPVGFISGFIVIAAIGFAGATIALLPLGLRLLRGQEISAAASA
jgi:hypothetical protein